MKFLGVLIFILVSIISFAQTKETEFKIVGIGLVSDSCQGDWEQKTECSDREVNTYLLANIDWNMMDSVPKGRQRIELKYDVDKEGFLSNIEVIASDSVFSKSFHKVVDSWPPKFKYLREDGVQIVGRYSSFFSFYF